MRASKYGGFTGHNEAWEERLHRMGVKFPKTFEPGWYLKWKKQVEAAFGRAPQEQSFQLNLLRGDTTMSYFMQEGQVYKLARSLRHPEMYAFPPGATAPEIVEVDQETATEMQFSGALVYIDQQTVAVFTHPADKNFVLGMVVDPEAVEEPPAEAPVEEPMPTNPTPEQLASWGYDPEAVCETCGYYIRDHNFDGESLLCPATE